MGRGIIARSIGVGLVGGLLTGVPVLPATTAQAAKPVCSLINPRTGAYLGNQPELALSHPGGSVADADGSVTLLLQRKPDQTLVRTAAGARRPGGQFGAAVALGYIDGDRCADVLVGAPAGKGAGAAGTIYVFRGATKGVLASGVRTLSPPHAQTGSEFGRALAIGDSMEGGRPVTTLWVGAPGLDVGGRRDAGGIYHFEFDSSWTPRFVQLVTRATPGVPGKPASGERFGEVLAPIHGVYGGSIYRISRGFAVAVGVPRADVAGKRDAGAVVLLWPDASGRLGKAQTWSQNSKGVAGRAESGDRFGAAVTDGAVGTPGEDLGRRRDAGQVQVFHFASSGRGWVPWRAFTQNTRGVPGKAESGDRFGAALAAGIFCFEAWNVAVGSPGEDLGQRRDVGTVTLLDTPNSDQLCQPSLIRPGAGLLRNTSGRSGDQFGANLAPAPGPNSSADEDVYETLLIGIPNADGPRRDSGVVHEVTLETFLDRRSVHDFRGPAAGARYGDVIAAWPRSYH